MAIETKALEGLMELASPSTHDLSDIYVLFYRTGMNPRPLEMHFSFPEGASDFRKVVERAKRFCDACGYKFTKVEKFLISLEEMERKARQG